MSRLLAIALILALILAPLPAKAEGFSLIRDAEIETCIREMAEPIFKTAGLAPKNVQIHIISDPNLNAFVAEGMNIFVNTGTITYSSDPMVLMGVLAHETGHIAGGHLIRRRQDMENMSASTILGMILGAASMATGAGSVGAAVLSGTGQMAERSSLKYSRVQEASADNAGLKFLASLHLSAEGMLTLLQFLNSQENLFYDKLNPYMMTHPLSKERIENVRAAVDNSPYSKNPAPEILQKCYPRSVAKLKAFIQDSAETLREYSAGDTSFPARYARVIAYYKIPQLERAIGDLDQLIKENPKDPYLYELKGQILFENGKIKESVSPYRKAVELAPGSALIKLGAANSEVAANEPELNKLAVKQLLEVQRAEPDDGMVWRELATAYGQLDEIPESMLALAEEAMLLGKKDDAARFATIARKGFPAGSPSYLRASDIIMAAGHDKKAEKH